MKRFMIIVGSISLMLVVSSCGNPTTSETTVEPVVNESGTVMSEYESTSPIDIQVIEEYEIDEILIGTWVYEENSITYTYSFNEDNTGEFVIADDAQDVSTAFTYSSASNSLQVQYEDFVSVDNYTYEINDNVLTLTDSFEQVMELTKAE